LCIYWLFVDTWHQWTTDQVSSQSRRW